MQLAVGCGMSVYVYDARIINNDSLPRVLLMLTPHFAKCPITYTLSPLHSFTFVVAARTNTAS